jgi:hypothetical protein
MSKNSDKANNFPVSEAIDAAAHFDVSGARSGIVELLSGNEALAEFYRKRADGAYYKPHQIYYAIYRPKDNFQAPIAPRHYQEGNDRPTVQDCEDYYNPIEPSIEGFPAGTEYPLPAGTPFFMKYLKPNQETTGKSSEKYGVYGTHEMDPKDRYNYEKVLRTYMSTKIVPKMGRSILRDTASRMGVKSTPVRDENGVMHNVVVTCTEVTKDGSVCGGVFKRDGRGDYVCQVCGIIYEREDKFVAEDLASDNDEFEYGDEDTLEEGTTQKDLDVGGVLPPAMSAVESRLSRNLAKFRASRSSAPKDEVEAKAKAHADKERHEKARKAFAKLGGHTVYENKIAKSKSNHAKRQVLTFVKQGVNTTGQLMSLIKLGSEAFYKLIADMETEGRITTEKVGKSRVVSVVATGKEYSGRAPALMVMPVLMQVRYGNVQGKTINYRNSKVIVATYDASAQTLYSRKE